MWSSHRNQSVGSNVAQNLLYVLNLSAFSRLYLGFQGITEENHGCTLKVALGLLHIPRNIENPDLKGTHKGH